MLTSEQITELKNLYARLPAGVCEKEDTDDGDLLVKFGNAHSVHVANMEGACGECCAIQDFIPAIVKAFPELMASLQ